MEDPMIDRAMKDWEAASADPHLRELYFDRRKAILDELAAVEASKLNAERAKAEGKAEGKFYDGPGYTVSIPRSAFWCRVPSPPRDRSRD